MKLVTIMRSAALGLLVAALAACVTVTSAKPGPYKVGSTYTVTLGREWSDVSAIMMARPKHVRLLSIDGPLLNRLYLTDGIAKGSFLVKPASKEAPTPTYRDGLSQTEIVEFVVDSVEAIGYERSESANIRPAKFGAADGLRFEVSAKTPEGLDMSGTALVAERGGKLFVILYVAPSEHYYAATLPEVERIMTTASLR